MSRAPKPPADFWVGDLRCYPERPPTERDPRWWWRGSYTANGRTKHVTIGRGTREEAEKRALELKPSLAKSKPKPLAVVRTVRDACEIWLGHQEQRAEAGQLQPRSLLAYRASVRRLVKPGQPHQIGDVPIEDVDETVIEQYALDRATPDGSRKGHAPRTINGDTDALLMALRYCRKKRLITLHDLYPTPLKSEPKRPTRTPTREEIIALMDALPERYALLVWLMYATGARIGEIAHLEWREVDLVRAFVRLGVHTGAKKTGAREVPLADEVVERLRAWRDRPAEPMRQGFRPVPPETRDRWVIGVRPVSAVSRLVKLLPGACAAIAESLNLDPAESRITSHAIRRWAVDEMGREDVEVATAASLAGHRPEEMWKNYRRPGLEDRRRAVNRAKLGAVLAFRKPEASQG